MEEIKLPNKKYKLIYVDPPWEYRNKNTGGSNIISGASAKYPTMSLEEIKNIPISNIAMDDSCIFIWATTPLLPEAIEVLKSWGYTYKTSIYWNKISLGMGFWFRGQVEICLFGIRGNIKTFRCQHANFIESKTNKHSQKPYEMYTILESLNLNPKIELFARDKREGWDVFGNETIKGYQKIF